MLDVQAQLKSLLAEQQAQRRLPPPERVPTLNSSDDGRGTLPIRSATEETDPTSVPLAAVQFDADTCLVRPTLLEIANAAALETADCGLDAAASIDLEKAMQDSTASEVSRQQALPQRHSGRLGTFSSGASSSRARKPDAAQQKYATMPALPDRSPRAQTLPSADISHLRLARRTQSGGDAAHNLLKNWRLRSANIVRRSKNSMRSMTFDPLTPLPAQLPNTCEKSIAESDGDDSDPSGGSSFSSDDGKAKTLEIASNSDMSDGDHRPSWMSATSRQGKRVSTMDNVRMVQEDELLNEELEPEQPVEPQSPGLVVPTPKVDNVNSRDLVEGRSATHKPQWFLYVFSVLRQDGFAWQCYGRLFPFVLIVLFALYLYSSCREATFLYLRLSGACYLIGGLVGLFTLRPEQLRSLLGTNNQGLDRYARGHLFYDKWLRTSSTLFLLAIALWLCAVLSLWFLIFYIEEKCVIFFCEADWGSSHTAQQLGIFLSLSLGSGLYTSLTYCQLHVCCFLELMVEQFCIRFFERPDLCAAVNEWNVLQALLRRAANAVDMCLLVTQTAVLTGFALTTAELFAGDGIPPGMSGVLWGLSQVPGILLAFLALFRGGAVTEKCSRVPSLMNTLRFEGSAINFERQYVVQYLEHSAAGFYIKGVRLTTYMVLKLAYLAGVVLFAFATRLRSSSS
eukprot:TRINITY_DN12247_c0_g1_i1.p1 TRINITY_DN12247_c0_g1~~TRINITY_DN12247_c0_g1_i1.p1  ORF type:complete len:743 (+),score=99.15 TRINITY_DN12247_c0_g1_i1:189-2231(+)